MEVVAERRSCHAERGFGPFPAAHAQIGRDREQRQRARAERKGCPGSEVEQESAGDDPDQRARKHRELLRPGRRGAAAFSERLGDEGAVRRRNRVQAGVRHRRREREKEVGRCVSERDRYEPARGQGASPEDEWAGSAATPAVETVAPEADCERDKEPGRRVDEHYRPDQARRVPDVVEEHGQIGRHEPASQTGAERRCTEGAQGGGRGESDPSPTRHGKRGHGRTSARAPGRTLKSTGPAPRSKESAITGRAPCVSIRTRSARHW